MKKSFLNLRKLGLVLVAAGSMAMYSCGGGEESHDENTENVEEASCGEGKCGDGAEEASCGEGKCGEGHDAEGEHKCEEGM